MAMTSSMASASPPKIYKAKGNQWKGTCQLERFAPNLPPPEVLFADYEARNPSMGPSVHMKALSKTSGLLELHYDTMRRKQEERTKRTFGGEDNDKRPFCGIVGYSGFVPLKESNNIIGCTYAEGNRRAMQDRPATHGSGSLKPFTLALAKPGTSPMSRSLPQLNKPWRNSDADSVFSPKQKLGMTGGRTIMSA
mmetsp:Transcript_47862/g.113741  ORF Transcript_47862/g.113741 Transcript_47862/m.113741 type:complete len:194 (+) Transcript_47862:149-730(+)